MWALIITIYFDYSVSQLAVPGFETKALCFDAATEHVKSFKVKGRGVSHSEVVYTCVNTKEGK